MTNEVEAVRNKLREDLIICSITHENAPPGRDCYEDCGVLKDTYGNPLGEQGGEHKKCMDCWEEYIDKLATQIDALYQPRKQPLNPAPRYDDVFYEAANRMDAPQPDELISDEEIRKIAEEVIQGNAMEALEFAKKLCEAQLAHCTPLIEARERERVLKDKLSFHVTHKEALADVGEWAECQGVGVFVFSPDDTYWQKGETNVIE